MKWAHLANYDSYNEIENDDLRYHSEEYFDDAHEDDENNHSNGNVVKRGITRLYKFRMEYGKPGGVKLSRYFDVDLTARKLVMNRPGQLLRSFRTKLRRTYILPNQDTPSKLNEVSAKYTTILKAKEWVNFVKYTPTQAYKVKSAAGKMARSKCLYPHTMGRGGYAHVKEQMYNNLFPILCVHKEIEDKIKEGTLKVDQGADIITVVLGKEKGGYARGVGSGVTYKSVDETSYCSISPQNDLGALLKRCKIIVWDEAPMAYKLCFEALDHSLRDILRKNRYDTCQQTFGNMMMVFGSDYGQVHPVIPKGSRQDIVSTSLKEPYLWDHCNVLKLTANMRTSKGATPTPEWTSVKGVFLVNRLALLFTILTLCVLWRSNRSKQEYAAAGTIKQNYVSILLMLLRLRQACDHPLLVKGCNLDSWWKSSIDKAKKLPPEKRTGLLELLGSFFSNLHRMQSSRYYHALSRQDPPGRLAAGQL
ncbi:hypothetical protein Tco_1410049 [Tanacetum coccineum]